MKLLYRNKAPHLIGGKYYFISISTDGGKLYVAVSEAFRRCQFINGSVVYNGVTKTFILSQTSDITLEFDYSENVKTASVNINGTVETCVWHGNYSDPSPNVSITHTGVREYSDFQAFFTYSGDAENVRLISPLISFYSSDEWNYLFAYHTVTPQSFSQAIQAGADIGSPYVISLLFACYASPNDAEDDYIGLSEYVLPTQYLTRDNTPYAPYELIYAPEYAGVPFEVRWSPVFDPEFENITYRLKRAVNGTDSETVYEGSATHFTDVLGGGTNEVSYSVCSVADEAFSYEYTGNTVHITSSNVFIGIGGEPHVITSLYVGVNGDKKAASPTVFVGN